MKNNGKNVKKGNVRKKKKIRKKNKYALYLYLYLRPLLKIVYKKIDRWK